MQPAVTLAKVSSFAAVVALAGAWAGCSNDTVERPKTGAAVQGQSTVNGIYGDEVNITYGDCQDNNFKCGGDVVGDWKLTSGCLDRVTMSGLGVNCSSFVDQGFTAKAAGKLAFTPTENAWHTTLKVNGKVFVPTEDEQSCRLAYQKTCAEYAQQLMTDAAGGGGEFKFDTATCTETTTPSKGCECEVALTDTTDADAQPYTTEPYEIYTTSLPPDKTLTTWNPLHSYEYCIAGSASTFHDTRGRVYFKPTFTKQ